MSHKIVAREDCGCCGGTGQITKSVAGRSGMVPCPSCDNIPEYAIPDEVLEDPEARIEEIDDETETLREEEEAWRELRSEVADAQDTLREVAQNDLVGDETEIQLSFLADQTSTVLPGMDQGPHYSYRREQLGEEKAQLQTLLDHLEGQ